MEEGITYSMRDLDMLHEHDHLLGRNEALEILPRLTSIEGHKLRLGTIPEDPTGKGKQVLFETSLARYLNLDRTITKAIDTTSNSVLVVPLGGLHGLIERLKLNISVHRLASGTIHYDVDWLISVVEDLGVAAKEGNDLGAFGGKRDLVMISRCDGRRGCYLRS